MGLCVVMLALVGSVVAAEGPNLVRNADFEDGAEGWAKYGKGTGFVIDTAVVHGGKASLRCQNAAEEDVSGAGQTVTLDQATATPVVIGGWSKAEGVSGKPGYDYSIYCDVEYTTDTVTGSKYLYGQVVTFKTGTHDWEYGEFTIKPKAPIKQVRFYVLFRKQYTGTVWFDDLFLRLAEK